MKKYLTLLSALFLSTALFAQFGTQTNISTEKSSSAQTCPLNEGAGSMNTGTVPTWTPISTHCTAIDINGNTVSTASILASGKAMVIDFSAVWCSWCWAIHQNGILEAIKNQLGNQVEVLWVEADPTTTPGQGLTGGTGSQGNWTVIYGTSTPVPYRVVDDANFTNLIGGSSTITGYPTVVFVSPTGYWCEVYGTAWGFGPYSATDAVSAVSNILASYPRANSLPSVSISGLSNGFVSGTSTYTAQVVSVDSIISAVWAVTGGTPATSTNNPLTVTWTNAGSQTVIYSVTNTTGTASDTIIVNVRNGWNWGDVMDYTDSGSFESAIGYQGGLEFEWGVLYPASLMTGRNYVTNVSAYIADNVTGQYTVRIYQGGSSNPQSLIYEYPYNVTNSGQWVNFPIYGGVHINSTQSMWVTLSARGYAATYTNYNGDPNSSLLTLSGQWYTLSDATNGSYEGTWMIKTLTSATQPPLAAVINGPASAQIGSAVSFSAVGPTDAIYNWTFSGATPTTATGDTVTVTWNTAGTYNVTLTATRGGQTITASHQISIWDCNVSSFPYTMGFESTDPVECWTTIDADGDGHGWVTTDSMSLTPTAHGGTGVIASASWLSNAGVLTPNNWLISPTIDLTGSLNVTLSWYDWGQDQNDYAEHYSVYVSTTGTNPADFTTQVYSTTISAPQTWTQRTVNLSAYAGQQIHIAFRHHNCSNQFWLFIDDVSITRTVAPSYTITAYANNSAMGDVTGGGTYSQYTNATLTAIPNNGYRFVQWQDGNRSNPRTVTVTHNATYMAYFDTVVCTVIVSSSDSTRGIASGGGSYLADTTITINATPMPHYRFSSWTISDAWDTYTSTANPLSYLVTSNAIIVANFESEVYTINAVPNNVSYGVVSGGGRYRYLETVTLTASTPYSGYHFRCWSNGASYNPYIFPATENLDITAIFVSDDDTTSQFFNVCVTANDSTMGAVSGSGRFPMGVTTTITATPFEGYRFIQWQDGNNVNPRTITVTADIEYIAYFAPESGAVYTITALPNDPNMGVVTGGGVYYAGDDVTLTARPFSGYRFVQWSTGSSVNPLTITAEADATFVATFAPDNSIDNVDDGLAMDIYPNPASGSVAISLTGISGHVEFCVMDVEGRKVMFDSFVCSGDCTTRINLANLAQGIYFVQAITEDGSMTAKKLVVK